MGLDEDANDNQPSKPVIKIEEANSNDDSKESDKEHQDDEAIPTIPSDMPLFTQCMSSCISTDVIFCEHR